MDSPAIVGGSRESMGRRQRVTVFAFGTRGDVLPLAVVAASLAEADKKLGVTFITHEAHRNLETHLRRSRVSFMAVSTPPVVPGHHRIQELVQSSAESEIAHSTVSWEPPQDSFRASLEHGLREECISAMDTVMMGASADNCTVIINFFALEGWHLAELYRLPCVVMAPYVVPYSAPSSFERRFRAMHPLLYRRLQEAVPGEVGWGEVMHWMWPLFTDRWAAWRTHRLHLSSCPFTDPVTELPYVHDWPRASPLLYGFSEKVVECPSYWPASIHVCGFWYAPIQWEAHNPNSEVALHRSSAQYFQGLAQLREVPAVVLPISPDSSIGVVLKDLRFCTNIIAALETGVESLTDLPHVTAMNMNMDTELHRNTRQSIESTARSMDMKVLQNSQVRDPESTPQAEVAIKSMECVYAPPIKLREFLSNEKLRDGGKRLIFVGLSSMGSMGFMENPDGMLRVLEAVLEATDSCAVLLTAGHAPLDLAVAKFAGVSPVMASTQDLREGLCCFNNRLFCFWGSVPYLWLLPRCSVAIHHGGSGTTAACLRSGVPQIICPFVLDQFYWAERMAWLGVAPQPLKPQNLMPDLCADQFESLVEGVRIVTSAVTRASSEELKRCASSFSDRIQAEDGTSTAVRILIAELCT